MSIDQKTKAELESWSPDFLQLSIHNELEHQLRLGMQGIEHAVVIGPRGVGKTHSVKWILGELQAEEVERSLADPAYVPREVLYYEASRASGTKTVIIDLHEQIFGGGTRAAIRFHTAASLIDQIVAEVRSRGICLICVDEAQMIEPHNLDLLRQVPDRARALGHPLGLVLVGSEELREKVVAIQQLGQRFSAEIQMPLIDRKTVGPHLTGFHPHLDALKRGLKKSDWSEVEADLFRAARGKFRRLTTVLANANALALRFGRRLDGECLRLAIGKLADEV
jgi:hypothetical protein